MAAIASGLNFSTLSEEGIALNICNTFSTLEPSYPGLPFAFGTKTIGLDNTEWVYVKPAAIYALGTVGYFDTSWNFTAITTTNAAAISGQYLGVMSQIANVTTPTAVTWDGLWVQTAGLSPAVNVAASTSANAALYTSATAGQLTSTSGGNVLVPGIFLTTAQGAGGAGNAPGLLDTPSVALG